MAIELCTRQTNTRFVIDSCVNLVLISPHKMKDFLTLHEACLSRKKIDCNFFYREMFFFNIIFKVFFFSKCVELLKQILCETVFI